MEQLWLSYNQIEKLEGLNPCMHQTPNSPHTPHDQQQDRPGPERIKVCRLGMWDEVENFGNSVSWRNCHSSARDRDQSRVPHSLVIQFTVVQNHGGPDKLTKKAVGGNCQSAALVFNF